jgi:hypothetical protein
MTAPPRVQSPTSTTWHGRHYVADRRWRIVAPDDRETVLCSAACAITWLCSVLLADLGSVAADRQETGSGAAA